MNCSELDLAIRDCVNAARTDVGFGILAVSGGLTSFALLLFGQYIARTLAGFIAFSGTTVFLFVITNVSSQSLPCMARVIISAVGGLAMAAFAWCLLKGGLFILGATAFGTVSHFVYVSLPIASSHTPPFLIMGRSGYYYIAVGVAGLGGAIVSIVMKKQFLRLTSSLIGGGGAALTSYFVANRFGTKIPSLVLVFIMLISAGLGVVSQDFISRYQKNKRKRRRRSRHRRRNGEDSDSDEEL